jgi:HlyD family secretion protein
MSKRFAVIVLAALAGPGTTAAQDEKAVLQVKGYVVAGHPFRVSPQSAGQIVSLAPNFEEGARFKKGDVLAVVDPSLYKARVDRARAGVRNAEILIDQAKTGTVARETERARSQLAATKVRYEGAVSREALIKEAVDRGGVNQPALAEASKQRALEQENVRAAEVEVARAEQAQKEKAQLAEAGLEQARADLAEAQQHLENCSVRAPADGTVLRKNVELGSFVNPQAVGVPAHVAEMADLSDLEIEVNVQERDLALVRDGQPCRVMPEAFERDADFLKGHPNGYDGVVSRVLPQADRARGALTVRVKVKFPADEAPGRYLRPDMGAVVSFLKK